jgi:hypothetical protein
MERRGQFYLVAVIVLVSIMIGFVTITNKIEKTDNSKFLELYEKIKIERRNVLDYISSNSLTANQISITLTNFSDIYIEEIGRNKNSIFIYGDQITSTIKGNRYNSEILFDCDTTGTFVNIPENLDFTKTCSSVENITISLDSKEYFFEIYPGQNIYYLLEFFIDEERYLIYG